MRLKLCMFAAISMVVFAAPFSEARAQSHVVEMFTSQGCNSCPPADAYLRELAGQRDVLALAHHVDYWDRLGWTDTLGSPEATARQRAYASRRGDGRVYTPQAIVDGRGHAVGSNRAAVRALMGSQLPVPVSVDGDTVQIGASNGSGTVWRVDYTRRADVPIARGENRGKTIRYVNSVRGMKKLGDYSGSAVRLNLGGCGAAKGADACAVIVQEGSTGRPGAILGAARAR